MENLGVPTNRTEENYNFDDLNLAPDIQADLEDKIQDIEKWRAKNNDFNAWQNPNRHDDAYYDKMIEDARAEAIRANAEYLGLPPQPEESPEPESAGVPNLDILDPTEKADLEDKIQDIEKWRAKNNDFNAWQNPNRHDDAYYDKMIEDIKAEAIAKHQNAEAPANQPTPEPTPEPVPSAPKPESGQQPLISEDEAAMSVFESIKRRRAKIHNSVPEEESNVPEIEFVVTTEPAPEPTTKPEVPPIVEPAPEIKSEAESEAIAADSIRIAIERRRLRDAARTKAESQPELSAESEAEAQAADWIHTAILRRRLRDESREQAQQRATQLGEEAISADRLARNNRPKTERHIEEFNPTAEQQRAIEQLDNTEDVSTVCKADIMGVLLGLKPAAGFTFTKTQSGINEILTAANQLGLKIIMDEGEDGRVEIAKDQQTIDSLKEINAMSDSLPALNYEKGTTLAQRIKCFRGYGKLFGYPATAVDFFIDRIYSFITTGTMPPLGYSELYVHSPDHAEEEYEEFDRPLREAFKKYFPKSAAEAEKSGFWMQ